MWDFIEITFEGLPATLPKGTSVSGRILNVSPQLASIEKDGWVIGAGGRRTLLSDAMFPLLASLARGGVLRYSVSCVLPEALTAAGLPKIPQFAPPWTSKDIPAFPSI